MLNGLEDISNRWHTYLETYMDVHSCDEVIETVFGVIYLEIVYDHLKHHLYVISQSLVLYKRQYDWYYNNLMIFRVSFQQYMQIHDMMNSGCHYNNRHLILRFASLKPQSNYLRLIKSERAFLWIDVLDRSHIMQLSRVAINQVSRISWVPSIKIYCIVKFNY